MAMPTGTRLLRQQALARSIFGVRVIVRRVTWLGILATVVTTFLIAIASPRTETRFAKVLGGGSETTPIAYAVISKSVGHNLLRVPVKKYREAILSSPLIRSAEIDRSFPHTLYARIQDREPYICVRSGEVLYTFDPALVAYRLTRFGRPSAPVLDVQSRSVPRLGKKWSDPHFLAAEKTFRTAKKMDLQPASVQIDRSGYICLNVRDRVQIRMGSPRDIELKLKIAAEFLSSGVAPPKSVEYINVSSPSAPAYRPRQRRP